jgi:hypothetical protein
MTAFDRTLGIAASRDSAPWCTESALEAFYIWRTSHLSPFRATDGDKARNT